MSPIRVGVVGSTGETGSSIINGLIEANQFYITAFTRPSSVNKPASVALKESGVAIVGVELEGNPAALQKALVGIEVLICAVGPFAFDVQYGLADAAKAAGVKRFVPSSFTAVTPPGGVTVGRDQKEKIFQYIKDIQLPYTVIDVGWWYQASIPSVPSGKLDYLTRFNRTEIAGDGNTLSATTDKRDIGRYVARIIADERTQNKFILAHSELRSPNEIYDLVESLSGEVLARTYLDEAALQEKIETATEQLKADPTNTQALWTKSNAEIQHSLELRGDNTPESAKKLGYLLFKELYPGFTFRNFESCVKEALAGQAKPLYESNEAMRAFLK
ncbi:hypothetical protein NLG97_g2393 [Lecanicillium saksenae]|uniref:Uncharacterized protein n=1 Tax=Lecanicillium saksenae TaxID=468837 RepID=A0ACC1R124_9HYPO|nr:hypothetical protein NLG97_g2393 [Lecanicillium saksenae]